MADLPGPDPGIVFDDAFSPTVPAVFGPEQWAIYRDQLLNPPQLPWRRQRHTSLPPAVIIYIQFSQPGLVVAATELVVNRSLG